MKKLNVLRCGDQYNWAYHFISKEHDKYSRHNIIYAKHDEVKLDGIDLVYIHSPDITPNHAVKIPLEAKARGIPVVGAYAGNPAYWNKHIKPIYSYYDLIVTISPQLYDFGMKNYDKDKVVFLPESVDTDFFNFEYKDNNDFVVGWAGGFHKPIKRTGILANIGYDVEIQDTWKEQRHSSNLDMKALEAMRDFYHSIDCLVVPSKSECMPRVVIEAMSCGKNVVATDVGGMQMLLHEDCIVPVDPDALVASSMYTELTTLKSNAFYREMIARRNRSHIERFFSWVTNAELWDNVFNLVAEKKYGEIKKITDNYLTPFKEMFKQENK